MVYNTMYPIQQRPYLVGNNRGFIKKKEDEESSQASQSSQREPEQQEQVYKNSRQREYDESEKRHQLAMDSRDANIKKSTVNIAQIIKDFKNTAKAIGTPPELDEEVNSYLELIHKQVTKDEPNGKIVRSNLKSASMLLDNYITETLQRPSKVVENWLDALFLQNINYNFSEEEVNAQFLVKFPGEKREVEEETTKATTEEVSNNTTKQAQVKNQNVYVPKDEILKSLFIQAKKFAYINESKKAMELFQKALSRAIDVSDKETESKVLFEIGKIYDKNDYLAQALSSYNKSLSRTSDYGVKTQAHFSMAQIYDDISQFEPAINHYMSSISYAGVNENLALQANSLAKIGNIHSDEYKKSAFTFLDEAKLIAQETDNNKTKGYVSSCIGNAYNKFNEPQSALKHYSGAIQEYKEAQSPEKVAINYKKAAEIMDEFGNPQKAKSLYKKALFNARQTDNLKLIKELHNTLTSYN